MTKFKINYHYAHTNQRHNQSTIKLIDDKEGVIEIKENFVQDDPLLVKFARGGISTIFSTEEKCVAGKNIKAIDNLAFEVDICSGAVAIKYTMPRSLKSLTARHQYSNINNDPYVYQAKTGYLEYEKTYPYDKEAFNHGIISYKPAHDFGYIMENPPRLSLLLCKELAYVENLQQGVLKVRTSSFDVGGYIVQLYPEAILDITQLTDKAQKVMRVKREEEREEKGYAQSFDLFSDAHNDNVPVDLLGGDAEAVSDVSFHG